MKKLFFIITCSVQIFSQAQQPEQLYAPYRNQIVSINKIDKNIYLGTSYEAYKSIDDGKTWKKIHSMDNYPTWFVKLGSRIFFSSYNLFYSDNECETFNKVNTDLPSGLHQIKVSNGRMYISDISNLYESSDTGKTWQKITPSLPEYLYHFEIIGSNIFIYYGNLGMFHSPNYGVTWDSVSIPFRLQLRKLMSYHKKLYAGTDLGFFVSSDLGKTWQKENDGLSDVRITDLSIDSGKIYASLQDSGIFVTSLAQINWQKFGSATFKYPAQIFADYPKFYASNFEGFFISEDAGITWEQHNYGIKPRSTPCDFAVSGNDVCTISGGIFRSSDNGNTWQSIEGTGYNLNKIKIDKNKILAGGDNGALVFSNDYGKNWTMAFVPRTYNSNDIQSLAITNNRLFAGTWDALFISDDSGTTWIKKKIDSVNTGNVGAIYNDNGKIFIGTSNGIYKSMDDGENWIHSNTGLPNYSIYYEISRFGNSLVSGTDRGFFKSVDDGMSWTEFNNGLPGNSSVRNLTQKDSTLYITSDVPVYMGTMSKGIFTIKPNDTAWQSLDTNLQHYYFTSISVKDNYLFAGVGREGVFRIDLNAGATSNMEIQNAAGNFILYPNPNNGFLNLKYCLKESEKANFVIYDLYGRRISEQILPSNNTTLNVDIEKIPNGIYTYSIIINGKIAAANKFVVTK